MIDCENEVFTRVDTALEETYPGINVSGEYVNVPSSFPHVSIVCADNYVRAGSINSGDYEADIVAFEVNIYSNKQYGKKTECKQIAGTIDNAFKAMNFRRLSLTPVPNMADLSIYRMVARYEGVTDGKFFYGRL